MSACEEIVMRYVEGICADQHFYVKPDSQADIADSTLYWGALANALALDADCTVWRVWRGHDGQQHQEVVARVMADGRINHIDNDDGGEEP